MKQAMVLFLFFSLISCNDKAENPICEGDSQSVEFSTLENMYGCSDTRFSLELNLTDDNMYEVISNINEYSEKVLGNCHPDIDFDSFDLIVGYTGHNIDSRLDSIHYFQNCSNEDFVLTLFVTPSITTNASPLIFNAILPKLPKDYSISIAIKPVF